MSLKELPTVKKQPLQARKPQINRLPAVKWKSLNKTKDLEESPFGI